MRIAGARLLTSLPSSLHAFYAQTLGFEVCEEPEALYVGCAGSLLRWERAAPRTQPLYHLAWNIAPEDFDAVRRELEGRVALLEVEGDPVVRFPAWRARALYFLDPAGNILEMIAREAMAGRERPRGARVPTFGLSEVGLVVPSVAAAVERLAEAGGFPVYDGGSGGDFAAVGDEEGLLIVSAVGRAWYPTATPAAIAPVEVVVEAEREWTVTLPATPHRIVLAPRATAWRHLTAPAGAGR